MLRREFIGGIFWQATTARMVFANSSDIPNSTLLNLAELIIPDRNPSVWLPGHQVAKSFFAEFKGLGENPKGEILTSIGILDASAIRQAGKKFVELPPQIRVSLVTNLLSTDGKFKAGFISIRVIALKAFYTSSVGHHRTGYYNTTQFTGYPEHVRLAEIWE